MAIKFPDRLESNNPKSYGIVKAEEISGHKTVKELNDLYEIPDAILSETVNNTDNDAIGQLWFVISENKFYQLINWENRKSLSGWEIFEGKIKNSIPTFSSEDDVPTSEEDPNLEEYVVLSGDGKPFSEDEDKDSILAALNDLTERVSRIERTFSDHMDCGDVLSNNKFVIISNDPSVEAIEPTWANNGQSVENPKREVPAVEPGDTDLLKVAHLSIKSGKWEDFAKISDYLLPYELVWIYDNNRLYIKKSDGEMYWINNNGEQ